MIRITDLKLTVDQDEAFLKDKIISRLRINERELVDFEIYKKSIDARRKGAIYFVYTVDVQVTNEKRVLEKNSRRKGITKAPERVYIDVKPGTERLMHRPIVIGTGPSGLFAGLVLSQLGYCTILLERGEDVDARSASVDRYWSSGVLDPESNVQFGEGGAGTFSDGKLTSLINDKRMRKVLEELVKAGAPKEILYTNKPHVGTDLLKNVVKRIREEIIDNGGEVRFKSKVTDFIIEDGRINGVIVNGSETLECEVAIMGIGHSARDTFEVLHNRGVKISPKPFSIGVRIEHPQELINKAQYGRFAQHPALGAADYKLAYHSGRGRSAYTFCMCPGGYVIAAASENNGIVTNGMSYHNRDGVNANAALLVGVAPEDYGSHHPLAGVYFQRKWESLAFQLAGGNHHAPAQLVGDFLAERPSTGPGRVTPTYKPGVSFGQLKECLPGYVIDTMKEALRYFDTKIQGFAMDDAVMTGVETRSSSPIRINRDDSYMSNIRGLYPIGEGAGYAGGIMSSAVDGIRVAEKIASVYAPLG